MKFYDVCRATVAEHYSSEELFTQLRSIAPDRIISHHMAQTIAAWWHSPEKPYSTRLSTAGRVDRYATLSDFGDPAQPGLSREGREALQALGRYLQHWQDRAPSEYRFCACEDCFDQTVGKIGDLCSECEESGCDNQGSDCERGDAYGQQGGECE